MQKFFKFDTVKRKCSVLVVLTGHTLICSYQLIICSIHICSIGSICIHSIHFPYAISRHSVPRTHINSKTVKGEYWMIHVTVAVLPSCVVCVGVLVCVSAGAHVIHWMIYGCEVICCFVFLNLIFSPHTHS